MSDDIPAPVRRAVEARSGGVCEGCGERGAAEKHHRLYRSRGGRHTVENLLDLCGWGNHTGCHGVAHSKVGEVSGWSIRSGGIPAEIPVQHALFGLVLLGEDGGWETFRAAGVGDDADPWAIEFERQGKVDGW